MMKLAIFTAGLFFLQLCLAENSYLIVLPKLFKVNCTNQFSVVCVKPVEINFTLVLGQQREEINCTCKPGETRNVTFPLPESFPIGVGELTIQGTNGIEFMEKREVIVYDDRHVLLVQTSSSSYRPGDTVELRVIGTDENLIPIESGEVTIEIFDSQMKLITDFKKVPIRNGLCETIRYPLPTDKIRFGLWLISATIENTTSSVQIFVSRPQTSSFDLKVLFPRFLLRTEKFLRGSIELSDDCDRPIFGNATITVGPITEQDLRMGEKTERVVHDPKVEDISHGLKTKTVEIGGRLQFNCDLTQYFGIDMSKTLALKVLIDVVDPRTDEHRIVQHIIPIFNRDVIYDITPLDFEPGQKNEYEILAKRPDGKPCKMEEVIVNVTMMFASEEPRSIEIKDLYTRGRNDIGLFNVEIPKNCIGVLLSLTPVGEDGKISGYRTHTLPLMPTPKARDTTGAKLTIEMMPEEERRLSNMKSSESLITTMRATVGKPVEFYVQLLPTKSMDHHESPVPMNYILLTNGRITATGIFDVEPTKYCQEQKVAPRGIRPETKDASTPPQCVYNGTLELMMTREMVPYSSLLVYAFNSTLGFNVAETYRFSVYGLFQNNLTLNVTEKKVENVVDRESTIVRDNKISPKARNLNRMDLTCTGLPDSIVGVRIISYDAINGGLPNDITKERLLRFLTSYESIPFQSMPSSPVKEYPEENNVSPRSHNGQPEMTPEQIKRQYEGYKIRYLFEKIAFGLRTGHRLRPVDGDDAYIATNLDHLYGDKKQYQQQSRLKDVFQSKSHNRERQYNLNTDKNDFVVAVGMPRPHEMPMVEHEHEHEEEEHRDDSSEQDREPEQIPSQQQFEYGTPQWYKRMNVKMNLLSKEAFIFMQSGLAVVSDFSTLQVPKEFHHMNITGTIKTFRQQSLMSKDQDSFSFRQNARQLLIKYMSELDPSVATPPPMMLDEQSRTTYYRTLMFNTTKLDKQGEGKFCLPRTSYPFTTWLATGFSLNSKYGLGIAQPIRLPTAEGLFLMVSPIPLIKKVIQIGERVPFSFVISNFLSKDVQSVLLRVRSSPDFDIVDGEKPIKMDKEYTFTIPSMKSESSVTRELVFVPKRNGAITMIMEVESEFGGDFEIVPVTCGGDKSSMVKSQTCQSSEWKWW